MKNNIPSSDIEKLGETKFLVKSQTNSDVHYNVDLRIGICECSTGETGVICKHQIACADAFMMQLPQSFKNTAANRRWLAGVAVGVENVPPFEILQISKKSQNH